MRWLNEILLQNTTRNRGNDWCSEISKEHNCYDLKFIEWDRRITLVLSNTRELDRDPFTN